MDYSLAPEQPFPDAIEDAYAILEWAASGHHDFRIDPHRVAVGGNSAGANIAAVLCLLTRDREGPPIVHQIPEVPVVDLTTLDREFIGFNLADCGRRDDPYVSPLLAPSHTGLPRLVLTAELDELAAKAERADVPCAMQVSKPLP